MKSLLNKCNIKIKILIISIQKYLEEDSTLGQFFAT
jgi:hypothetical protein